jgi:hypothetical protein
MGNAMNTDLKGHACVRDFIPQSAADLVDYDRLQNHFLLSSASLGSQLLRKYDLGPHAEGKPVQLTSEQIAGFFFPILDGKVAVPDISGEFDMGSIVRGERSAATRIAESSQPKSKGFHILRRPGAQMRIQTKVLHRP